MNKNVNIDYSAIEQLPKDPSLMKKLFHPFPHGVKSFIPGYNAYKMLEPLAKKIIDSATLTSENDAENIKKIIKAGKDNGVDEMTININKKCGIDAGVDLNQEGIPIEVKFKAGVQGETELKIKYK